jgi:hypothetical protein
MKSRVARGRTQLGRILDGEAGGEVAEAFLSSLAHEPGEFDQVRALAH